MTEIDVKQKVLAANAAAAAGLRETFARTGTLVVNLISSPGSGKTTLLEKTVSALKGSLRLGGLEGAGGRGGRGGEHVELGHLVVERLGREVDAIGVLVIAEADGQGDHTDVVGSGLVGGQVGGAVGDDLDGHEGSGWDEGRRSVL